MKKNLLFILFVTTLTINAQYEGYSVDSWNKQVKIEEMFSNKIDKSSFKKHLKKLTERPHVVGSDGNAEVIEYIGQVMDDAGFKVTNYPYDVYLPNKPGESLIEIVKPYRDVLNQKKI